jgi:hypothetical protein
MSLAVPSSVSCAGGARAVFSLVLRASKDRWNDNFLVSGHPVGESWRQVSQLADSPLG